MKFLIKKNVQTFKADINNLGGYRYTGEKLSSKIANKKISNCIEKFFDFNDKVVLDCGCGDGSYTLEFIKLGAKNVIGMDPVDNAIQIAKSKSVQEKLENKISFFVGDIYAIQDAQRSRNLGQIDVVILRGVLHHLSDQMSAIASIAKISNNVIIMEPNGSNPILKIIEKTSQYHIDHEEQSFSFSEIKKWLSHAGFKDIKHRYINLVPFFCPDWFAMLADFLTPIIERIPLLRKFACGQIMLIASK
jgi:SAM-dependent methyltransferase